MSFKAVFNKQLFSYKKATLGPMLMALVYILVPWFSQGAINETLAIFGIMWLMIAVMRAKGKNTVLGGLTVGFIGVIYIFAIANIINLAQLWTFTLLLTGAFFILEMGFVKLGKITQKSDAFQLVPLTIMSFTLIAGIAGYTSLIIFNAADMMGAINYIGLMLFCILSMLQVAGWNIMGKNTNMWITIFAVAVAATAFLQAYGISMFQWS